MDSVKSQEHGCKEEGWLKVWSKQNNGRRLGQLEIAYGNKTVCMASAVKQEQSPKMTGKSDATQE